jgi:hypothetical protein
LTLHQQILRKEETTPIAIRSQRGFSFHPANSKKGPPAHTFAPELNTFQSSCPELFLTPPKPKYLFDNPTKSATLISEAIVSR